MLSLGHRVTGVITISYFAAGLSFNVCYSKCREQFLVNSDSTLKAQLIEFRDHKLITSKKVIISAYQIHVFIHLYFSKKTSMQTAGRTFTARRLDEISASYWQIRSQLPSVLETGYFVARRLQRTWIYRQWQQWTRYQLYHQGKIQKRSLSTPRSYSSGTQEKGLFLLLNALKILSWWFICATINLQIGRISKSLKTVLNTVEPCFWIYFVFFSEVRSACWTC